MLKYSDAEENKRGAYVNALFRNKQYEHTYTPKQRAQAQTLVDVIDLAYKGSTYVNYRKQFISVKLAKGAFKRDKHFAQQLTLLCVEKGYAVVTTPQGTIYRIAREA